MSIELLTAAIFLAVAVLIFAGLWVVFIAPAAGRQMRRRLAAIQQTAEYDLDEAELQFVRDRAMSSSPALDRILVQMKSLRKLQLYIAQSGVEITVMTLIGISFGLAVFTYLICVILQLWIFSVVLAVCVATIPGLYIGYKRYRRFWEFEQQFPDALEMLTRNAATSAIASSSASRVPEPIEKCAVCAASPSSTRLPATQFSHHSRGKRRQCDWLTSRGASSSTEKNRSPQTRALSASSMSAKP